MDLIAEKINKFFGVYPDDIRRRSTIAIIVAIIGAVLVLMGLLYIFSSFTPTISSAVAGLKQTTSTSQGIGMFLMFIYAMFIGSLMYYVFLPWKPTTKKY